jgi:hypothetical protein
MPISPSQPLTLPEIATYWSRELQGTLEEESADSLLEKLRGALFSREIEPQLEHGGAPIAGEDRIRREEFLLWVIKRRFQITCGPDDYPRPRFWDRTWAAECFEAGRSAGRKAGFARGLRHGGWDGEPPPHLELAVPSLADPSSGYCPHDYAKRNVWRREEIKFIDFHQSRGFREGWNAGVAAGMQYAQQNSPSAEHTIEIDGAAATSPVIKKKRGPPKKTEDAVAMLRARLVADQSLLARIPELTEKELQHLCGGVSRDTAKKARHIVLGGK